MFFKRFESEGLAHFSYMIGENHQAVVIDPRRDVEAYIDEALANGYRISDILETHRNEDYVIGSRDLAHRTGAQIWHADSQWDYQYGSPVEDGQLWGVGEYTLTALHTPGHTPGHMSYILGNVSGEPYMVFTGDCLFAGDVGRVDLLGKERSAENAALLYESIFERILPVGDGVIICPAHGAGSVCGGTISSLPWTTIGVERKTNPRLQHVDKDTFVRVVANIHEQPPYFARMEEYNTYGAPLMTDARTPMALGAEDFADVARTAFVLDTRKEPAFGAAHIPLSISIWHSGLARFAGWFLPYDRPLLLVSEDNNPMEAVTQLGRLGYDNVAGYLAGGMHEWLARGLVAESVQTVTVQQLCKLLDERGDVWLLDVRSDAELETQGRIAGAHHLHITQARDHLDLIPRDRPVYIFCGSGLRSMTVASMLKQHGWLDVAVALGGLSGWKSISCPVSLEQSEEEMLRAG